jgi:indole-3-glycerol phosphate synthase
MPVGLDQLVAAARRSVAGTRGSAEVRGFLQELAEARTPRSFRAALAGHAQQNGFAVIAELKKASPSRGLIRAEFDVRQLARDLAHSGAAALSVLTEPDFFQGSVGNLELAAEVSALPCLRKDFIVDEFQLLEARAFGADAVLLIVAALKDTELTTLRDAARQYALDVLCEVHDETELRRALALGFDLIGVNNRDLKTFRVDLNTALNLAPLIPAGVLRVAESGISTPADIVRLRAAGYQAFLIGESLMQATHPGDALHELIIGAAQLAGQATRA